MSLRLEGIPLDPISSLPRKEAAAGTNAPRPSGEPSEFTQILEGVVGPRLDAGEALMERALEGNLGRLEAPELIAIQAGIYRYTEVLDFTAKLLDRATNSVKTVLQAGH
jgi:hypothetical protein